MPRHGTTDAGPTRPERLRAVDGPNRARARAIAPRAILAGTLALALALAPLHALAQAPATGAGATSEPPGALDPAGLIAFVDPDGRVGLIDPTAPAAVGARYGAGLERAQFPAWSGDGHRIAVVVSDLGGGRVDLIDVVRGGEPVTVYRVAGQAPIYLAWAPGDRTLAVLANTASGLALDLVDVEDALAGAAGASAGAAGAVRPFARGAPFYWSWLASGRSMVVHRNVMSASSLVGITGIDAFDVRTPLPDPGAFQSPTLSMSERYVAYAALGADGQRRVVAWPNPERPDVGLRPRSWPHHGVVAFAWRPGHEQLSVQSPSVPSPHAFGPVDLADVASGRTTRISDDQVVASWWSPDGRWLATLSPVGGGADRPVIAAAGTEAWASERWPDVPLQRRVALLSLKVIDVDTLETRVLGAIAPSPLFVAQYLPFFDQYARSHRLWSPRSDALVLPVLDDDGVATIVVFRIDGRATPLAAGDLPAWNVR